MKVENMIIGIISELLSDEEKKIELNVHDKLKDIGMDSLSFVRMIVKIEEKTGIEFPMEDMIMTERMDILQIIERVTNYITQIQEGMTVKKFVNTYVKYTAKKPILFILLIFVSVSLILYLTITTKTSVFQTYDARIKQGTILVDGVIASRTGQLYVYANREEQILPVVITETEHGDGITVFYTADSRSLEGLPKELKADIPVDEISLLERIFLRGGKGNE